MPYERLVFPALVGPEMPMTFGFGGMPLEPQFRQKSWRHLETSEPRTY